MIFALVFVLGAGVGALVLLALCSQGHQGGGFIMLTLPKNEVSKFKFVPGDGDGQVQEAAWSLNLPDGSGPAPADGSLGTLVVTDGNPLEVSYTPPTMADGASAVRAQIAFAGKNDVGDGLTGVAPIDIEVADPTTTGTIELEAPANETPVSETP